MSKFYETIRQEFMETSIKKFDYYKHQIILNNIEDELLSKLPQSLQDKYYEFMELYCYYFYLKFETFINFLETFIKSVFENK